MALIRLCSHLVLAQIGAVFTQCTQDMLKHVGHARTDITNTAKIHCKLIKKTCCNENHKRLGGRGGTGKGEGGGGKGGRGVWTSLFPNILLPAPAPSLVVSACLCFSYYEIFYYFSRCPPPWVPVEFLPPLLPDFRVPISPPPPQTREWGTRKVLHASSTRHSVVYISFIAKTLLWAIKY